MPSRTERYWRSRFRAAEQTHGCGFVGLLDNSHLRGNRADRLGETARVLMTEHIKDSYETPVNRSLSTVHRALVEACNEKGRGGQSPQPGRAD